VPQYFEGLREYCQAVAQAFPVRAIYLFGSYAKGEVNEGSDIDLAVVADFGGLNFLDRIGALLALNRWRMPLEPLGYTPEEFDDMRGRGNQFVQEVLAGRRLYP